MKNIFMTSLGKHLFHLSLQTNIKHNLSSLCCIFRKSLTRYFSEDNTCQVNGIELKHTCKSYGLITDNAHTNKFDKRLWCLIRR